MRIEVNRVYECARSHRLVLPIGLIREHGLEEDGQVEVISNDEVLVRPVMRTSSKGYEVVRDESV